MQWRMNAIVRLAACWRTPLTSTSRENGDAITM
jgi:hypothetical protein